MATIYIDGKAYKADPQKNLLESCLSHGLDLPYFCWHPALGSIGACRQCAVKQYKDEDDEQGKIVMSCMEPSSDGARISLEDQESRDFRAGVIEFLMTNHPHDCPTCDEGGECHLQDMTVMSGHNYRRYRFNKRTYRNQNLGPCLNHEMNRCIQCYRCVRFYNDYAGGKDLEAMSAHNSVYFGRHEDGTLESEFSGNLAEVCPTGVFTDKTLKKHYTRKWDFTTAPSVCNQCSLGCNIIPGERYGELRRIQSRYNSAVNGYFICDRGRFGYEYVNSPKRIRRPMIRQNNELQPAGAAETLSVVKDLLDNSRSIVGVGSAQASLEANFMLRRLVGESNFYHGMSRQDWELTRLSHGILTNTGARIPSLKETEKADAILVLGEDLTNSAPMMALSVRQAIRNKGFAKAEKMQIPHWHDNAVRDLAQQDYSPLFIASTRSTKLDEVARNTIRAAPGNLARFGYAIAHYLDGSAPPVSGLSGEMDRQAKAIAEILADAKQPLIISGTSMHSPNMLKAAANVARAAQERSGRQPMLSFVLPEANSMGMAMMGGKSWESMKEEAVDTAVVLETDLRRLGGKKQVDNLRSKIKNLVVLGYLENETTANAEVVIPAGTFAESDGTLVNNEGRAQRYYQVFDPEDGIKESWRWLGELMQVMEVEKAVRLIGYEDYLDWMITEMPQFKAVKEAAPSSDFRINGQKIPRASHRYSGRTAINTGRNVSEPKPPDDPDSPLSFTMEGSQVNWPSSDIPRFWSPGWNSQQAINKFQIEVGGELHGGDPGVRLIDNGKEGMACFNDIPEAFQAEAGQWLVVGQPEIFGSERLSMYSPALRERSPAPYLALNEKEISNAGLQDAQSVKVTIGEEEWPLTVKTDDSLPDGIAAVPYGIPQLPVLEQPQWITKENIHHE